MERMISYNELPEGMGQKIYLRLAPDPIFYLNLLRKGYRIVNNTRDVDEDTIYVSGVRQAYECFDLDKEKTSFDKKIRKLLSDEGIEKPATRDFRFRDLIEYKYKIPFVLKNEIINGGKEKFLIATEEDYQNLINACTFLIYRMHKINSPYPEGDKRNNIDYDSYLNSLFSVQEYIETPTRYSTSIRVLTSSSDDVLAAFLKYNTPERITDETSLLGYLLREVFPLSTNTITSNTLTGGNNLLIGKANCSREEQMILDKHNIPSDGYYNLINAAKRAHSKCGRELGILCGFDFIYDESRNKWFLLEYHGRPMVGDYAVENGLPYKSKEDRIVSDERTRATALSLALKKRR